MAVVSVFLELVCFAFSELPSLSQLVTKIAVIQKIEMKKILFIKL